jgi:membrane-bound serine protease (ClpP class)
MLKIPRMFFVFFLFWAAIVNGNNEADSPSAGSVFWMEATGTIDPVVKDYLLNGLQQAQSSGATAVVIRLDTPGGLLDATRDIVQGLLNAPLPVIVFVGPQGARAASAGVFITLAADVAAMAPQTHLGAAHPVSVGGMPFSPGGKDENKGKKGDGGVMEEKALSDTAAYARTLAATKGRNAVWAEKAVRESLSLTSEEALKNQVIDLVATDEADLLKKLSGKEIKKGALTFTLALEGAPRVDFPMSPLRKWLHTIANPNVAYLLLVLGFYALIYEFSTPGIGLGAIAGIICLVLAFFSLQVLPLNFAGLVLLVAGLIMMGLDIVVGSHGLLIFGGLISFALGSFFLFDVNQAVFRVSLELILAIVATSAGFFGFVVRQIWSVRRKKPVTGAEGLVGQWAEVRPEGMVFVDGALWTVEGDLPNCVPGEKVRVVKISGNRLVVQKEA